MKNQHKKHDHVIELQNMRPEKNSSFNEQEAKTEEPKSSPATEELNTHHDSESKNTKRLLTPKRLLTLATITAVLSFAGLSGGIIVAVIALIITSTIISSLLEKKSDVNKAEKNKSGFSWINKSILFTSGIVLLLMATGAASLAVGMGILCLCAAAKIISSVVSSKKINRKEEPGKNLFKNAAVLLGGIFGIAGTLMLFSLLGPGFGAMCLIGFAVMACVALCRQFNLHKIFMNLYDPNAAKLPRKPKKPKEPKKPVQNKKIESHADFAKRETKYNQDKKKYDAAMEKYDTAKLKYDDEIKKLEKKSLEVKTKYDEAKAKYEAAKELLAQNPQSRQVQWTYQDARAKYEKASAKYDKAIFIYHKDDPIGKKHNTRGEMQQIKESIEKSFKNTVNNFYNSYQKAATNLQIEYNNVKKNINDTGHELKEAINNTGHNIAEHLLATGKVWKSDQAAPAVPTNKISDNVNNHDEQIHFL